MHASERWKNVSAQWFVLSYYQRFESLVALVLTLVIGLITLVALFRLTVGVATGLLQGALDPLDHKMFQVVFGDIMTLLIALEFNHTLQYIVRKESSSSSTSTTRAPGTCSGWPSSPWCWASPTG